MASPLATIIDALRSGSVRRCVVVAGAGISVPSGIPDFRSPGDGLFAQCQEEFNLPYPTAIFDLEYFRQNPAPFYSVARKLYGGNFHPSTAHWLARILQDRRQLLRVYTQNIDGLERAAGVSPELLVEAHGTLRSGTCLDCGARYTHDRVHRWLEDHGTHVHNRWPTPTCDGCGGVNVKPDVVFYGESLPARFMLHLCDMRQADFLLVLGTSLEVYPFASIVDMVMDKVPRLLVNRYAVGSFVDSHRENDCVVEGELESSLQEIIQATGWRCHFNRLRRQYAQQRQRISRHRRLKKALMEREATQGQGVAQGTRIGHWEG